MRGAQGLSEHSTIYTERKQLTEAELVATRRIASLRVHVERAIERIKNYLILDFIPSTQFDIADQLFVVCSILADFQARLIN